MTECQKNWQYITEKPNIVIFEGWCVGAAPQRQKDLFVPLNILEKEEDKKEFGGIGLTKS